MKSPSTILLLLVVAGLSVVAWIQHGELNELRAKFPDTVLKLEKTERQLNGTEANIKELEKQLEEARHPVLVGKTDAGVAGANGRMARGDDTSFLSGMAAFMDRPAMQRMMAQQQKAQVDHRFKKLFA